MISPICKKGLQSQNAGKRAMLDIIPDQDAILAMNHHNCLLEMNPVYLIGKLGRIIQAKFLEKVPFLGMKDTGILTA
jgi:hypothetical protein